MSSAQAAPCPSCLTDGRSSGRTVHPGLAPAIVCQAFVRPLTITRELANTGQLRRMRCGWLQVASCNITPMRAARLV